MAVPPAMSVRSRTQSRPCSTDEPAAKRWVRPPGSSRWSGTPGPTSRAASSRIYDAARGLDERRRCVKYVPRVPGFGSRSCSLPSSAVVLLLWWRGPELEPRRRAFTSSTGSGSCSRSRLNLASVARALARLAATGSTRHSTRRGRASTSVFSAFSVGLLRQRGAAGPDRRARSSCRARAPAARRPWNAGDARRHRLRAPLFDLVPVLILILYVFSHREDPALGDDEPAHRSSVVGVCLFTFAVASARRPDTGRVLDELGAARRRSWRWPAGPRCACARRCGAAFAILLQVAGWVCQLLAV